MKQRCLNCGKPVYWQNDFDYEDYCIEGDGVVSVWFCPSCGTTITCEIPSHYSKEEE